MQRNDNIVPRLSRGAGDGVNHFCAMQVVSWQNGDTKITDYPRCSARPLARLVQICNDNLADADGFLSPEDSITVLDLGWRTVGTADVPKFVIHAWIAELLDSPEWGVIRVADTAGAAAVRSVADLHRRVAADEVVPVAEWESAAAASATTVGIVTDNAYAASATAYAASATAYATYAAAAANAYAAADAACVEFTAHAIDRWRTLAGLDAQAPIRETDVDAALDWIATSATSPQK